LLAGAVKINSLSSPTSELAFISIASLIIFKAKVTNFSKAILGFKSNFLIFVRLSITSSILETF